jgi:hypothetical protein
LIQKQSGMKLFIQVPHSWLKRPNNFVEK